MPSQKSLARERVKRGLKELERGRPAAARPLLEQAVALDPADGYALGYLGTALLELGETAAAITRLEQARSRLGAQAWIAGNLAEAYSRDGRYDAAIEAFRHAARLDPANLSFELGVATSLAMQGHHEEAAHHLETLLRRSPGHPLLWFNLGTVRRDQQRLDDAASSFRYALEAEPDWPEARNSLGATLHALLRFDEAEQAYRICIDAQPERIDFRINLASLLIDAGRSEEAEALCRDIVNAAPDLPIARTFLAAALVHQGKLVQALDEERIAAKLEPENAQAAENLANTLAHLGRAEEAWPQFDRAIALQADATATRHARALALLAHGRLDEGWADYDSRPASVGFATAHPGRSRCRALAPDTGTPLTLLQEQGLGDELFFLRFARRLEEVGARSRYASSTKLRPLLSHAEPVTEYIDERDIAPDVPVMPIGDLPHVLRRFFPEYPSRVATDGDADYPPPLRLHANATAIEAMQRRLQALGPPPYIALTWSGGVPPGEQRYEWTLYKTIDPALLGRTLRDLPRTLISVQRKPIADHVRLLEEAAGSRVHDCSDLNDALEDMLALLSLVDDYVGVSNTNMHIRAGANKAARVLIPAPAEWRWPGDGASTPWFPGFTCYRQARDGSWQAALEQLRADLRANHAPQ